MVTIYYSMQEFLQRFCLSSLMFLTNNFEKIDQSFGERGHIFLAYYSYTQSLVNKNAENTSFCVLFKSTFDL